MPSSEHVPARPSAAVWVGVTLAALVSTVALAAAAGHDRRSVGLATSPFGWNRLIVMHTLASLPLAWWCARTLADWIPDLKQRWLTAVWCVIGLIVVWLTIVAGVMAGSMLESSQAGYAFRLMWRVAWCLALQVPWCMVGLAAVRGVTPRPVFSAQNLLALGLLTALGVPLSFMPVFLDQQTVLAQGQWQQAKLSDAWLLVQRLCDVGSTQSLGQRSVSGADGQAWEEVTPAKRGSICKTVC